MLMIYTTGNGARVSEIDCTKVKQRPTNKEQAALSAQLTSAQLGGFNVQYQSGMWTINFWERNGTPIQRQGATFTQTLKEVLANTSIAVTDKYARTR